MKFKFYTPNPELSKQFISLVGDKNLAATCEITLQALTWWKKNGIPKPWSLFLKQRFKSEWISVFGK